MGGHSEYNGPQDEWPFIQSSVGEPEQHVRGRGGSVERIRRKALAEGLSARGPA